MRPAVWLAIGVGVAAVGTGVYFLFFRDEDDESEDEDAVAETPAPAALAHTHPQDVEALGRMITSEEGGSPQFRKEAVAWATINTASRRGVSIFALLTRPTGGYARQGPGGNGYATTAREASPADAELARQIYAGERGGDITGGATGFDSPKAQRAAVARGVAGYVKTPEQVAADRRAEGLELVLLPGVPEDDFRMWRPV
jgi:hypothetical protein